MSLLIFKLVIRRLVAPAVRYRNLRDAFTAQVIMYYGHAHCERGGGGYSQSITLEPKGFPHVKMGEEGYHGGWKQNG